MDSVKKGRIPLLYGFNRQVRGKENQARFFRILLS
jgi:hypothetical protein